MVSRLAPDPPRDHPGAAPDSSLACGIVSNALTVIGTLGRSGGQATLLGSLDRDSVFAGSRMAGVPDASGDPDVVVPRCGSTHILLQRCSTSHDKAGTSMRPWRCDAATPARVRGHPRRPGPALRCLNSALRAALATAFCSAAASASSTGWV